ncbi:MAG: nitroreductase family protein [Acidobacteriaceae bacterium]
MAIDEEVKSAPVDSGILDVIRRRWSPRSFSDREVTDADLVKLFTAAGWAASSYNEQPWRFLVGRRGEATYDKILDALVEFNQVWAKTAPVLILSVSKMIFSTNGHPNALGLHDTGAASANMSLQAAALGLQTHGMGGVDRGKARASFAIPEDFEVGAAWALGYPGDPEALPIIYREMEKAARTRKPLREFVFKEWERAAELAES